MRALTSWASVAALATAALQRFAFCAANAPASSAAIARAYTCRLSASRARRSPALMLSWALSRAELPAIRAAMIVPATPAMPTAPVIAVVTTIVQSTAGNHASAQGAVLTESHVMITRAQAGYWDGRNREELPGTGWQAFRGWMFGIPQIL